MMITSNLELTWACFMLLSMDRNQSLFQVKTNFQEKMTINRSNQF